MEQEKKIDQIESWFILALIVIVPLVAAIILPSFVGDFWGFVGAFAIILGLAWLWWKRVGSRTSKETQIVFGIVLAFAIVYQSVYRDQNQAEAMVAMGTIALAIATFLTLQQSIKQADESRTQARDVQLNSAAPVVALDFAGYDIHPSQTNIKVNYRNVGRGPALNFRCWIEDKARPELRTIKKATYQTVLAVELENIPREAFLTVEATHYYLGEPYIRAQYESVFGVTYESALVKPANGGYMLEYGQAKETLQLK